MNYFDRLSLQLNAVAARVALLEPLVEAAQPPEKQVLQLRLDQARAEVTVWSGELMRCSGGACPVAGSAFGCLYVAGLLGHGWVCEGA